MPRTVPVFGGDSFPGVRGARPHNESLLAPKKIVRRTTSLLVDIKVMISLVATFGGALGGAGLLQGKSMRYGQEG